MKNSAKALFFCVMTKKRMKAISLSLIMFLFPGDVKIDGKGGIKYDILTLLIKYEKQIYR